MIIKIIYHISENFQILQNFNLNIFENFAVCFIIEYSVISVKFERT